MTNSYKNKKRRELTPIPKAIVNLYGLIAVILVIIPEWIAEFALEVSISNKEDELPQKTETWGGDIDLQLASMSLLELRRLAKKLKVRAYSSETRNHLSKRLFKKLSHKLSIL